MLLTLSIRLMLIDHLKCTYINFLMLIIIVVVRTQAFGYLSRHSYC